MIHVHRPYRLWFLTRLGINFAAGVAVLAAILYLVLSRPLPGDYAALFYALRTLSGFLWRIIAVSVLAYVLLSIGSTALLCVYGLHKMAGPLYRMERVIAGYLEGSPSRPVMFRAGDQFEPLAEAFNGWIGTLRQDRQRLLSRMETAERLCLQDEATCRAEMARALREVEADLSRYR